MKPNLLLLIRRLLFPASGCVLLMNSLSFTLGAETGISLSEATGVGRVAAFTRPVVWIGPDAPSGEDTSALADAFRVWFGRGEEAGLEALEAFVESYTNSAWLPSLESQLGKYYRERGRYTLALQHWASSWAATKDAPDGPAKGVADFTLAFYSRLLASLGRIETLDQIFAETAGRTLDQGPLSAIYMGTVEGWAQMHREPGRSYRCGAFALSEVARVLRGSSYIRTAFSDPSPASGFSVSDLVAMQNKIN